MEALPPLGTEATAEAAEATGVATGATTETTAEATTGATNATGQGGPPPIGAVVVVDFANGSQNLPTNLHQSAKGRSLPVLA